MNTILTVENLFYTADVSGILNKRKSGKTILKNINIKINKDTITGIAGESGSGKTTLAKVIAGIITPTSGKLIFDERIKRVKSGPSPVQILFQNNGEILNPFREIDKIVEEAVLMGNISLNSRLEAESVMNSVAFPAELRNKKGFQLSGGEQQRAALARLLAVKPRLLILDEPFSAQDPESQLNLLNLFKKINADQKITMICIAHNLQILKKLCDEIIIMYNGSIVESGSTREIFKSPKHPYTKFLLKADSYNLSSEEIFNESKYFSGI